MLIILFLSFSILGSNEVFIVHKEMKDSYTCEKLKEEIIWAAKNSPSLSLTRRINKIECLEVERRI